MCYPQMGLQRARVLENSVADIARNFLVLTVHSSDVTSAGDLLRKAPSTDTTSELVLYNLNLVFHI
jgi:hypothetical protein